MHPVAKWRDLSYESQLDYLRQHRKSKFRPTNLPNDPMLVELMDIGKTMGGLNGMVEGKLDKVKTQAVEWRQKLVDVGFQVRQQEVDVRDQSYFASLLKDGLEATVSVNRGKMRYFASFEVKQGGYVDGERVVDEILKAATADTVGEDEIFEWFSTNPPKSDEEVHEFAKAHGVEPDVLEQKIYDLLASFTNAGRYKDYKGPEFDPEQLQMGIKVEMEHTTNPKIAERISKDHLSEISDYYDRLRKMEADAGVED